MLEAREGQWTGVSWRRCFTAAFFVIVITALMTRSARATMCPGSAVNCATVMSVQDLRYNGELPQVVYTSNYYDGDSWGGGVLYILQPPNTVCTDNGGSVLVDNGRCYYAQTFPSNVTQWGAYPDGSNSIQTTTSIQNKAAALLSTGGIMYFPPGTFVFSAVVLPDEYGNGGAHLFCAGKDATTLHLADGANTYMFATYNYEHEKTEGASAVEINGCKIDLDYQNGAVPGIIIEATGHSRIHDNEIDNGNGPAIEIRSEDKRGHDPNGHYAYCNTGQSGDYAIVRNVFIGSYGPAVKGFDDGCAGNSFNLQANGLSDGVIQDNVFSNNGQGVGGVGLDYQVTIDNAAGWGYRGNKSFGGGCGDLYLAGLGSTVISGNRFDVSQNFPCNGSSTIESIVLAMGGSKGFTFSGNSINDVKDSLPMGASAWDALKITNDVGPNSRATVGDNIFANKNNAFDLNAISYSGAYASASPLVAIGNAYNGKVTPPAPDLSIILGTEQYLTMTANGTQLAGTNKSFPVSGFVTSSGLTIAVANQVWAQSGTFTVAPNCGQLGTAPGGSETYSWRLFVDSASEPVTCTFTGSSTVGSGSGSTTITAGQTVSWRATQSAASAAANPALSLIFVRQ